MAIRKRGNSWQIDYIDPTGKRVRKSFKKKKDAVGEHAKRVSLIAENPQRYLEISKASTVTFKELVEKYEKNFRHQKCYKTSKKFSIEKLNKDFSDRLLSSITYYDLETYRNELQDTPTRYGGLRKPASVNRVMACLRHMFAKAVEWEMIERSPFEKGRSLQLKENNSRLRYLSEKEIVRLLAACPKPKPERNEKGQIQGTQALYLKDFVIISINTGMRKREVLSLKWDQIRNGFIYLKETKTNEARQIPINQDLEKCLKGIRKRNQFKSEYLFPERSGGYLKDIKSSFHSSLKRAGITNFTPHDLRHTFASHYLMRGGSLKGLKEILGHKDIKMTMRYAHLSKEFVKEEIQILNGLTTGKKKEASDAADASTAIPQCHKTVTFSGSTEAPLG
jgi:integrase